MRQVEAPKKPAAQKQAARNAVITANGGIPLERARARAGKGNKKSTLARPAAQPKAASTKPQQFVEGEFRGKKRRVPEQFYELNAAGQAAFLDQIEATETKQEEEKAFERIAMQLLDRMDSMEARMQEREAQLEERQLEQSERIAGLEALKVQAQVQLDEKLVEAQSEIAHTVANVAAITADANNESSRRKREDEHQAIEHENRLAKTESRVASLEGRLKSAGNTHQQSSAAAIEKASELKRQLSQFEVELGDSQATLDQLNRAGRVAHDTKEIAKLATDMAQQQMRDQFYGSKSMAETRAWYGLNLVSLDAAIAGINALESNQAIPPKDAEKFKAAFQAQINAVQRVQGRTSLPGANSITGDPLTMVDGYGGPQI